MIYVRSFLSLSDDTCTKTCGLFLYLLLQWSVYDVTVDDPDSTSTTVVVIRWNISS